MEEETQKDICSNNCKHATDKRCSCACGGKTHGILAKKIEQMPDIGEIK